MPLHLEPMPVEHWYHVLEVGFWTPLCQMVHRVAFLSEYILHGGSSGLEFTIEHFLDVFIERFLALYTDVKILGLHQLIQEDRLQLPIRINIVVVYLLSQFSMQLVYIIILNRSSFDSLNTYSLTFGLLFFKSTCLPGTVKLLRVPL